MMSGECPRLAKVLLKNMFSFCKEMQDFFLEHLGFWRKILENLGKTGKIKYILEIRKRILLIKLLKLKRLPLISYG